MIGGAIKPSVKLTGESIKNTGKLALRITLAPSPTGQCAEADTAEARS